MPNRIKYPVVDGMKFCPGCNKRLPIDRFARARRHYAACCGDCRKVYAAEYRSRPENRERAAEYAKKYMQNQENRDRANANMRRYNKTPEYRDNRNKGRRGWSLEQKKRAVEYKGGKCVVCGYSACLAALDFHHKNPAEKDGYGTGALKSHWSWERNRRELDKCVLVCVRCHREIHAGITTI